MGHPRSHLAPRWGGRRGSKTVAPKRMVASPELCLLPLRDTATGPPVAVETPHITSAMGPRVRLSKRVKGHGGVSEHQRGVDLTREHTASASRTTGNVLRKPYQRRSEVLEQRPPKIG